MKLGVPIASYQYWTIEGTVDNNSAVALDDLNFEVTVKDGHRIIAQENAGLCNGYEKYSVPAGQARTFHSCALHFKDMPAAQSPTVSYRVIDINGHAVQSETAELLTQEQREQQRKLTDFSDRVIFIEVDEPLKDFERKFPPGFGATHEESRQYALALWTANTALASSPSSGCSGEITQAWKSGRKGLKPHHDNSDRFRLAAAICGDLSRAGEPLFFLNCNSPFRQLCQ